jgi:hypothetical protein
MSKPTPVQLETYNSILSHGADTRLVNHSGTFVIVTPSGKELPIHQATAQALIDKRMVEKNWIDDRPGYFCVSPDMQEVEIDGARAWYQEWDPTFGKWRVEPDTYCPFRVYVQIEQSHRETYLCYTTAKARKRTVTYLSIFIEIEHTEICIQSDMKHYGTILSAIKEVLQYAKDSEWVESELCWALLTMAREQGINENALWRARYGDWHTPSKTQEVYSLFALVRARLGETNVIS